MAEIQGIGTILTTQLGPYEEANRWAKTCHVLGGVHAAAAHVRLVAQRVPSGVGARAASHEAVAELERAAERLASGVLWASAELEDLWGERTPTLSWTVCDVAAAAPGPEARVIEDSVAALHEEVARLQALREQVAGSSFGGSLGWLALAGISDLLCEAHPQG